MPSVWFNILDAVKDRVAAVSGAPVPEIRKRPVVLDGDVIAAPAGLVLICPGGAETRGVEAMPDLVSWDYPVIVAMVQPNDRVFEVDTASQLELREGVRNALSQPLLPAVASVWDTDVDPLEPFSLQGPKDVYEVTGFRCLYKSRETRVA